MWGKHSSHASTSQFWYCRQKKRQYWIYVYIMYIHTFISSLSYKVSRYKWLSFWCVVFNIPTIWHASINKCKKHEVKKQIQILDLDLKLELCVECGYFCKLDFQLKNMKNKPVDDCYSSHYLTTMSSQVYLSKGSNFRKKSGQTYSQWWDVFLACPLPLGSSVFDLSS